MFNTILKQGGWRSYLLQSLLFVAMVVVADYITGSVLKLFYQRQSSGWDYGTRYSAEETTADVVIFGASRAQQQYNPVFIEDSLHLTCYNAGRDGTPFFYHYAMLQAVLKRYTPKIVILDCEYAALKKSETSYERLSPLLPLYSDHPEMRSVINLRSPFEKYKFISHIYPYNSMIFKIAVSNLESNKKEKETIKGYMPLMGSLHHPVKTYYDNETYELDSLKVNMLHSFIDDCKKRNIDLLFICPPYYMNTVGDDYSMTVTKQIAADKKVDFWDYSRSPQFINSPQLFDDTVHVNFNGSKIFSAMVAHDLKNRLQENK